MNDEVITEKEARWIAGIAVVCFVIGLTWLLVVAWSTP